MLKVKLITLFENKNGAVNLGKLNKGLEQIFAFPFKNAGLKFDVQTKLQKTLQEELKNYEEMRVKILSEHSTETEIEVEGKKTKTKMKVIEGKPTSEFNVDPVKINEVNRQTIELLETEVSLNCLPLSLKKFEGEDASSLDFYALEPFIVDDRG